MIAYIDGPIQHLEPTFCIIDIQGVGYEIKVSLNTYAQIKRNSRCKLHTFLHIKEDAHTLYGFHDTEEKAIFLELIGISGIGPNTALMMTSSLTVSEIKQAIVSEDVKTIQSVKGIGGKTAQRVIIELKDKFKKEGIAPATNAILSPEYNTVRSEALSALLTLGIPKNAAEKSINSILKSSPNDITLEEIIKLALKQA